MKITHSEKRLCTSCMEEHEVKTVCMKEQTYFKNVQVEYEATYFYCDNTDELYMDENLMKSNDIAIKDAYRKEKELLTSEQIVAVRKKYGISQTDLCILLGWGGKTITRYESHQVQDKAHDSILRKVNEDSEWFLCLLEKSRNNLSVEAYKKYWSLATILYEKNQDKYLRKSIEAKYARVQMNEMLCGNTKLSLDKVVEMIRYFAASDKVINLYKVKLMKMMWYADAYSYKKRGYSITGLAYQALPMGAVPIGHESIVDLKDVPCEEVDMGETYAYYFHLDGQADFLVLSKTDKEILDIIISKFGQMSKKEIVDFMHKEEAYRNTAPRDIIQYKYAMNLQI